MAQNSQINPLVVVLIVALVLFLFGGFGMMGYGGMMSGFYGGFNFGWLFMILVFVALVLLIVWLIKQIQK